MAFMTTTTAEAITLSADVREKLLAQAKAEGRSEAELLDEAVRAYLDRGAYRAAIQEGLDDVKAGRGVDAKASIADARERLQARLRSA